MYVYLVRGVNSDLSRLRKNENKFDILHYQKYLPMLYENNLKYLRLNLFKEITFSFNHGLQTTSKSPTSLFDGRIV